MNYGAAEVMPLGAAEDVERKKQQMRMGQSWQRRWIPMGRVRVWVHGASWAHHGSSKKPTRNIFLASARAVTSVSPLSPSIVPTGVVSARVAGRSAIVRMRPTGERRRRCGARALRPERRTEARLPPHRGPPKCWSGNRPSPFMCPLEPQDVARCVDADRRAPTPTPPRTLTNNHLALHHTPMRAHHTTSRGRLRTHGGERQRQGTTGGLVCELEVPRRARMLNPCTPCSSPLHLKPVHLH